MYRVIDFKPQQGRRRRRRVLRDRVRPESQRRTSHCCCTRMASKSLHLGAEGFRPSRSDPVMSGERVRAQSRATRCRCSHIPFGPRECTTSRCAPVRGGQADSAPPDGVGRLSAREGNYAVDASCRRASSVRSTSRCRATIGRRSATLDHQNVEVGQGRSSRATWAVARRCAALRMNPIDTSHGWWRRPFRRWSSSLLADGHLVEGRSHDAVSARIRSDKFIIRRRKKKLIRSTEVTLSMSRSIKKGPFLDPKLAEARSTNGHRGPVIKHATIKTWARASHDSRRISSA